VNRLLREASARLGRVVREVALAAPPFHRLPIKAEGRTNRSVR
jgi:hypothetical protein